jgi:periplasmic copper chaperone A
MTRSTRSTMLRAGAALAAVVLSAGRAATPAQAHETPKLGSPCAVSGMTEIDHGKAYVCVSRTEGRTPRWGRGLTISRSPLTVANGWVKAAPTGMTAGFGVIANPTAKAITVIGAFTSAAKAVQVHEVVAKDGAMVMQQKAGGLVIPAGGAVELMPGGNHLMLVGLTKAIRAGDLVPVTLITADGGLLKVKLLAKVYSGANESYASGM